MNVGRQNRLTIKDDILLQKTRESDKNNEIWSIDGWGQIPTAKTAKDDDFIIKGQCQSWICRRSGVNETANPSTRSKIVAVNNVL